MKFLLTLAIITFSNFALSDQSKLPLTQCATGKVLLSFELENGKPKNIKVLEAVPKGAFEDAAIAAMEKENFSGRKLPPVKTFTKSYSFKPNPGCKPNAS